MEAKGMNDRDTLIDLESGNNLVISEYSHGTDANFGVGLARTASNGASNLATKDDQNQHMDCSQPSTEAAARNGDDRKSEGEEKLGLLDSSGGEKAKKKRSKKPPRPPRPPTVLPLDASDQKLLNELNELALLKRARIERMKALKKMKNAKHSSTSNFCPMIVTIIFCLVILWQGFFSRQAAGVSFHGSPESSVREHNSLISIRFYKNRSSIRPQSLTSAAPNNLEMRHRGWRSLANAERLRQEHAGRA
ncbi:uncharacterized protein LOC124680950 [Lolium rigidum]|uniref:uncharacterized protein LOC124680950 n=1 Tax=Lolium rigidum TaxID=89674 RepID=UPI001F5E12E6|nr:uncharacterized protein LOC124680950 [Lolium rigidum]XP_047071920.1 uncharacterized protein LOC124680950 [Lolium rigidum]XP_047071921.1 uncharacterized protein LOC124680950 [Lolium rigidum]